MGVKPITVSQLNEYINRILITDPLLNNVTVKGEASGVKYHSSGHIYFSVIDEFSKINCFLPRDYVPMLGFKLQDGMDITLIGSVNVFKKNGTYSIFVKHLELNGEGSLAIAFEKLKQKLNAEGLFDPDHKMPIPRFPKRIGIVTSGTGAALEDMLKIIKSRNNVVDISIFPVLVQGEYAASDIAKTLGIVNDNFFDIDLLIVGRGGGSIEDLWPFNEEILARSIYASSIPIISAVGHEIDFTICDMVADLRAETPTAAAQMAVPDIRILKEKVIQAKEQLFIQLSSKIRYNGLLADKNFGVISDTINTKIKHCETVIENLKVKLEENNPSSILSSGYSIIESTDGGIISDYSKVNTDDEYTVHFNIGHGICKFTELGSDDYE